MIKILVVIAALAPIATNAEGLCIGKPIAAATAFLAASTYVVGTQPVKWEEGRCGGGLNERGERIPEWTCFKQKWRAKMDGTDFTLLLAYSKVEKTWRLSDVRVCMTRGSCETMPLLDCEDDDSL